MADHPHRATGWIMHLQQAYSRHAFASASMNMQGGYDETGTGSLDAALDAALEMTFPASDPVALFVADPGRGVVAPDRVGPQFNPATEAKYLVSIDRVVLPTPSATVS